MPYAEINQIRMYYEKHGRGEPLVLLDGALGAIDAPYGHWAGVKEQLVRCYQTIEIEHRGHGRTNNSQSKLTYKSVADDLINFIEGKGLAPVHLGGVSDGAIVGLYLGMARPDLVKTLLCLGANYHNDELVIEANRYFDVDRIKRINGKAEQYAATHDRNKYPGYWRELVRQLAENLVTNPNFRIEDLARIPIPTLLMSGEKDPYANPQQMIDMRRAIPKSEMLIVNNADHFVQRSHPQIIGPVVLDFLERHANPEGH